VLKICGAVHSMAQFSAYRLSHLLNLGDFSNLLKAYVHVFLSGQTAQSIWRNLARVEFEGFFPLNYAIQSFGKRLNC